MKRIVLVFLVLAIASLAAAAEETFTGIAGYYQRVMLSESGDADISIDVSLSNVTADAVLIPLNCKKTISSLQVVGDERPINDAEMVRRSGAAYVRIPAADGGFPEKIRVLFSVSAYLDWAAAGPKSYGNYVISYNFVNTSDLTIADFAGEMVLPRAFVVHNIVESVPKVSSNDAETPYKVTTYEGSHSLVMRSSNLAFGSTTSVRFNIRKGDKSLVLLIGFLVLALLYLIFFKDVLKEKFNGG